MRNQAATAARKRWGKAVSNKGIALDADEQAVLECREDEPNRLFGQLAVHELDLVLSDIPLAPGLDVSAYNHVMGEATTTLFAARSLASARELAAGPATSAAPSVATSVATTVSPARAARAEQRRAAVGRGVHSMSIRRRSRAASCLRGGSATGTHVFVLYAKRCP